jgi:phospholipid-binding lipoprotein MlaA
MFLYKNWQRSAMVVIGLTMSLCSGCAAGPNPADPWEKTNRSIYNFNEGLDRVALKPLADGYVKVIPKPIRTGIGNGFDNLDYFNVVCNDVLQSKWNQGLGDFGRFAVNSTIGIGGIFDVATALKLPEHDNDLGITLRKWGAKPGPYLVLPFFGPSTIIDSSGLAGKYLADPLTWLNPPLVVTIPLYATGAIDLRSRYDTLVRFRNESAVDPYAFTREAYLGYRQNRAGEGKPATPTGPSIYDEDQDTASATTQPAFQRGK